jgi:glutamine phosphoribosylpyrophosphate amidotransferase
VARKIGADKVIYQSLDALKKAVRTFRHQLLFEAYQRTVFLSPSANGVSGSQPRARMRPESMA